MKLKPFFLSITLLFSGILVFAQDSVVAVNAQDAPRDAARSTGYTIGPGDQLAGTVHGEMGYDFVVNVDEDGMVVIPFIKTPLIAQCKTERQLQADIASEIKKYLRDPSFALRVSEKRSRPSVSLSGEIMKQMEIILTRKASLIEILSVAGGIKEEASGQIQVVRPKPPICMPEDDPDNWRSGTDDPTDLPSRTYSYANVQLGKMDSNPVIYPGDRIIVKKAPPVYVTGQVVGGQGVFLKEDGLSLVEAIGKVGGPRPEANKKNISIYRLKPGSGPTSKDRELISANLNLITQGKQKDVMLQAYDIIVVDKAKKPIGLAIAEIALSAARSAAQSIPNTLSYKVIY